ncbi:tetratricopeptide repeat protein [Longispora urticae]
MTEPRTVTIAEHDRLADGSFTVRVGFGDGAEYEARVTDPAGPAVERELTWYFEEYLRYPFLDHDRRDASVAHLAHYGEALFAQVFTGPAHVDFQVLRRAGFDGCRLVVSGSAEFHRLHWEALRDPADRSALAVRLPMVRRVRRQPARFDVPPARPTLNILVVTARPDGARDVGYRTISRPLLDALRQARLPVTVDLVRPGTWAALRDRLRAATDEHGTGWYQVVHFDLHGGIGDHPAMEAGMRAGRLLFPSGAPAPFPASRAFLHFETAVEGSAEPISADQVAELLAEHRVPVAVLNACQSAMDTGDEASLAQQLVGAGVPVAVGMAYSVTVSAAERAMPVFYGRLAAGAEPLAAVHAARRALHDDRSRRAYFDQDIQLEDWLLPVAFQQQPLQLRPATMSGPEEASFLAREAAIGQEPHTTYGFVGRDLDIQRVERRLLTPGSPNQLLVQAMAGAGKSTLLAHLGWWWQRTGLVRRVWRFSYEDRAWTGDQIVRAIAGDLLTPAELADFDSHPEAVRAERVARRLRAEPYLLVLDNVESVTAAPTAIPHALTGADQRRLLAFLSSLRDGRTLVLYGSREAESWLADGTFAGNVHPLPGLDPQAASVLAERILSRHGATRHQEDPVERDALKTLIASLGGYPLPMTVVLPTLATLTPTRVLADLSEGGTDADPVGLIGRAVEYSHGKLDPAVQRALLLLAPFTGTVPTGELLREYHRFLAADGDAGVPALTDLETAVAELVRVGLATPALRMNALAVQVVPVLPYFLRTRLEHDPALREAATHAHYRFMVALANLVDSLISRQVAEERAPGAGLAHLFYPNLTSAAAHAMRTGQPANVIVKAVAGYLNEAERPEARRRFLEDAIASCPEPTTDQQRFELYDLHNLAGSTAILQHRLRDAEAHFRAELALKQAVGDRSTYANTYGRLAQIAFEEGHLDDAERYTAESLELYLEFGDRFGTTVARHRLGAIAQLRGQLDEAEEHYRHALATLLDLGDHRTIAHSYAQLGELANLRERFDEAEEHYHRALEIDIAQGDWRNAATTYSQLGNMLADLERFDDAEQRYRRSLEIRLTLGDTYGAGKSYHNLALVAHQRGRVDEARRLFGQAIDILTEFGDTSNLDIVRGNLALLEAESDPDG